jgi:hypothetical protein
MDGFDDLGRVARQTRRITPTRLEGAVRTRQGRVYLVARYSDGSTRILAHDPSPEATRALRSECKPRGRRPRRVDGGPLDEDDAPLLDEDDGPPPDDDDDDDDLEEWPRVGTGTAITWYGGQLPSGVPVKVGDGGGAPGLPCLRVRDGYLERCEGQGYARVGRLPIEKHREKTWLTYLAQGAYATFVIPLAVSFDVALAAAYVFAQCH